MVNAVTLDEVNRVANKYLDPSKMAIVIVSDRRVIERAEEPPVIDHYFGYRAVIEDHAIGPVGAKCNSSLNIKSAPFLYCAAYDFMIVTGQFNSFDRITLAP
ncbi:MAG: hypothetical protein IPG67_14815 [Acidobacteria bacterium]|nr:hypothetical protein [Acidobacteriota bacterium]